MIPGIVAQAVPGTSVPGGVVDPYWDNVVFLLHGQGADASTVFTDLSQYGRPVSAAGAAQNDTDISVGDTPSIKFDANGNYLVRDYGYELNISGSAGPDFCMEAYVYCTNLTAGINQIFGRRRNSDNYILQIDASGNLNFSTFSGTSGTTRLSVPSGMSNNTVHHVAVIRVGTTYYGFVDGVLKGSNTQASGAGVSSTALLIGESENDQATRFWRGNLNWMRITMGASRYNLAGFTPPTIPYAMLRPDPVATPSATFSNVVLLLGFEGADGATTTTDESSYARAMTFNGNAQIDTAQARFGSSSLLLDGTADYLTTPDATELKIPIGTASTDAFCMEAWVRVPTAHKTQATILNKRPGSGAQEYSLLMNDGVPQFLAFASGNAVISLSSSAGAISLDEWHHIAATADGVFYRLFVDGVLVAIGVRTTAPSTNAVNLFIGRDGFSSSGRDFEGWIDEVRIVKGESVYTQTFIPPASAFPRS